MTNKEQKAEPEITAEEKPEVQIQKEVKAPCLPFPQRMQNHKLDKQFQKVLNVFKQLDINIPFLEAVTQMPKYAKCLKDILSNKRKWDAHETIPLNEECSAVIRK